MYHSLLTAPLLVGIEVVSSSLFFSIINNTMMNIFEVASLCTFLSNRISGSNGVPSFTLRDAANGQGFPFTVHLSPHVRDSGYLADILDSVPGHICTGHVIAVTFSLP